MSTLYLSSAACEQHDMGASHPESPDRLRSIESMMLNTEWGEALFKENAPILDISDLVTVHPSYHVDAILERAPGEGLVYLDADTAINPHSVTAALHAAGAGVFATDQVLSGSVQNAFCAVRPPGHHAESTVAMGFCIFNSVALAAKRALSSGMARVAILDFDVHHGNGTVEIFQNQPDVLVCSSFQYPFYPGRFDDVASSNICLTPLCAGAGSDEFRQAIERDWLPAIAQHKPEMIFVSAGFDAHQQDPLAGLNLVDDDFLWITRLIVDLAERYSDSRLVSMLEGGYNLDALVRSVELHIGGLLGT
jgi:acetoin utilization deacetylase AcuC-like enzyme